MDSQQLKTERQKTLNSLRLNANQSSAWQTQLLNFVEELNRDNLKLRAGYGQLKRELDTLKEERVVV